MTLYSQLIGTGTAIAAAASGLVIGETLEPEPFAVRSSSSRRKRSGTYDSRSELGNVTNSTSRPGSSLASIPTVADESATPSLLRHPTSRPPVTRWGRPASSQFAQPAPKPRSRRPSLTRHGETPFQTIAETPRESFSSNTSWLRRLSRPLSQHGSELSSSVGPGSSIAFSHGSAAPMLGHAPVVPIAPNKLVKRAHSTSKDEPLVSRRRAKSHLPTLRRPATSHQRSATLNQLQNNFNSLNAVAVDSGTDSDQVHDSRGALLPSLFDPPRASRTEAEKKSGWASFFHSKTANTSSGNRIVEIAPHSRSRSLKRILLPGLDFRRKPHLIKARMVSGRSTPSSMQTHEEIDEEELDQPFPEEQKVDPSVENTPQKLKRTLSTGFSSAGEWVARTSGSVRRSKRDTSRSAKSRHVSDSATSSPSGISGMEPRTERSPAVPNHHTAVNGRSLTPTPTSQLSGRQRNTSSPIPPLSRLSSFNVDISRAASPVGAPMQHTLRPHQPSGSSTSSAALSQLRAQQYERASALDSLEGESRDCMSGDDDDTDFKSDTMFDSIRTGISGRNHAVETPLDSLYDESPPSTAGNGKSRRLSIQEMLGKSWDDEDRIMEEDESTSTPVRTIRNNHREPEDEPRFSLTSSQDLTLSSKDFGRLSIEDEFNDGWTSNDDAPYNALSPPSKGSSLNSRGVNPNVRMALANLSGSRLSEISMSEPRSERPLSNLFDWSEPAYESKDLNGRSIRPKTSYANQERDARGGRSAARKGMAPAHVRSQSVPNVQEVTEEGKSGNGKFGTWGLGTKTISEDWDDDFEFGSDAAGPAGNAEEDLFAVPESIQASQPSVRAHSGQIRELSLLVNDLQRLCRHAREMDLLDGTSQALWKEAEGIIALASPDDDELDAGHDCSSSVDMDAFDVTDQFSDDGFDATSLEKIDAALESRDLAMSKTTVVRERLSPRRRSVFSPDDDIFGGKWPVAEGNSQSNRSSSPMTPEGRRSRSRDMNGVVRTVMEAMQQKPATEQHQDIATARKRMHFDTNSLRVLVKRAGDLRDTLSDIVRSVDQITSSPVRSPWKDRCLESSPAFTKVFDDPSSSPPRRVPRSHGNTPMAEGASPSHSPPGLNRRLQTMTVG